MERLGVSRSGGTLSAQVRYSLKSHTSGDEERARSAKVDSANQQIALGMSEAKRYEILKDKAIVLSAKADYQKMSDAQARLKISEENIEFSKYGDRVRWFKKIGEEFSAFHKYYNDDIKLEISFSKENMRESVSKQRHNYMQLAKLIIPWYRFMFLRERFWMEGISCL
ncbi:MAG: hypothetical protein IJW30_00830 [Clostridia bacterium]|nr:hypothetical protein [Clostridia bacterium]